MVTSLRASRRRRMPRRPQVPTAAALFSARPAGPAAPALGSLLALLASLLAVADGLAYLCSGAWLLPAAAELAAGVITPAAARPRPPAG